MSDSPKPGSPIDGELSADELKDVSGGLFLNVKLTAPTILSPLKIPTLPTNPPEELSSNEESTEQSMPF